MRRVLIIGNPGSGKSRLAAELGTRKQLPVIHLDQHFWRPGWITPDRRTWRRTVRGLAAGDQWIMDGNFSGSFEKIRPRKVLVVMYGPQFA